MLASVGGFFFVSAVGACCAMGLAAVGLMPIAQAVHVVTLIGFVAWCAVAMWVFAAGSLRKVTLQLGLSTLAALGVALLVR
ncbi:MAG: iron transporter [Pseudomonadota bacterium]